MQWNYGNRDCVFHILCICVDVESQINFKAWVSPYDRELGSFQLGPYMDTQPVNIIVNLYHGGIKVYSVAIF